jgi:hypothetical protein
MADLTGSLGQSIEEVQVAGIVGTPSPAQTIQQSTASGTNASIQGIIPAAAGKWSYLTGFVVSGLGATAAGTINVSVTGILQTMTIVVTIPAGVALAISPLVVFLPIPLRSSAVNTAIVVTVPAFGAGNTAEYVWAGGYQQ